MGSGGHKSIMKVSNIDIYVRAYLEIQKFSSLLAYDCKLLGLFCHLNWSNSAEVKRSKRRVGEEGQQKHSDRPVAWPWKE